MEPPIKDTLGAQLLSFIWRLSSGGRFESLQLSTIIISIGAIAPVLYIEVVLWWEVSIIGGSTVYRGRVSNVGHAACWMYEKGNVTSSKQA